MSNYLSIGQADRVLEKGSIWGLMVLYACYLSKKTNKPFILDEIAEAGEIPKHYCDAYIFALGSAGCFEHTFTITSDKKKLINVFDFDSNLNSKVDVGIKQLFETNESLKSFNVKLQNIIKKFD